MSRNSQDVSGLLAAWSAGDQTAQDELLPLVYDELRRLARSQLRRERPDHTLQPTALVHEAYLRLVGDAGNWQNRAHFFGIAARLMRQILINHAEARATAKRGGAVHRLSLGAADRLGELRSDEGLIELNEALKGLAALDPRQEQIVELRFFGGLTVEETAVALGLSPATVKREWSAARAWLRREITRGEADDA